jgi:nitrate reductase gamma subunit
MADLMGLFVLMGLSMAAYRRYVSRPSCLDTGKSDTLQLVFLFLLVFSGFLTEGLRIALSDMPQYEAWAFIGYLFAGIFSGCDFYALQTLHYGLWWFHMLGAFAFIGLAATGKPGHMMIDLLNVYYGNLV